MKTSKLAERHCSSRSTAVMAIECDPEIMDFLSMITRVPNHLEVHHGTLASARCCLIVSIEVLISNSGLDD